jgi:hypothetical protein
MTKNCDEHEIDVERRAHGALGPEEARALDEHLAGCERCRAFAALVGGVDAGLRGAAEEAARAVRWDVVERRLGERARRMRRARWLVPVALLATAAVAFALGLPAGGALVMAGGAVATTVAARALAARWLAELARAEASREGLLAFSRKQVDAELRAARVGSVALAALAVAQVAVLEVLGPPTAGGRAAVVAGAALLLVTAAALGLREAPRLRRERAELS